MITSATYFLFIVMLPIVLVVGGLVSLFAVGAFFDATENLDQLKGRIEAAFRGTLREPRPLSAKHYYQPYWRS